MGMLQMIFSSILSMSITASFVAIAVIVARYLLKRAPKVISYALWLVVLFRLLCPISFASEISLFAIITSPFDSIVQLSENLSDTISGKLPEQNTTQIERSGINTGLQNDTLNKGGTIVEEKQEGNEGAANGNSTPVELGEMVTNTVATEDRTTQNIITIITYLWVMGVIILFTYSIISYFKLKQKVQTATKIYDNIFETDQISTPFVFGFIKPMIYLPVGIGETEVSYILQHEQTHIRRYDYLIKPVAFFTLILHWFNPFMWLSFQLMIKDMEMSCDESVMRKLGTNVRINYSNSLLVLAMKHKIPSPSPLAFGESNVKTRIKNILNYKKPSFWMIIIAAIGSFALAILLIANPIKSYSIYEHPESFVGKNSLKNSAKVYIVDQTNNEEYLLIDKSEIEQITKIVEDMRLAKKELSKSRSGKPGLYWISYYNGIDDDISDYRYIIHIDPLWVDNNVKPSYQLKLLNEAEIINRLKEFIKNIKTEELINSIPSEDDTFSKGEEEVTRLQLLEEPLEGEVNIMLAPTELGTWAYYVPYNKQLAEMLNEIQWSEVSGFPKNTSHLWISIISDDGKWSILRDGTFYYYIDQGLDAKCFHGTHPTLFQHIMQMLKEELRFEPLEPSQLIDITSAEISYRDSSGLTYNQRITDIEKLQLIEERFSKAKGIPDLTKCPFHEAILNLEKRDGTVIQIRPATDGCSVYFANGICFEFAGNGQEILELFDQIPWRNYPGLSLNEPSVSIVSQNSPNNKFCAESYGKNTNITAGGLYPAEGIRIYEIASGNVLWEMQGYYDCNFLWSGDSRYVAISYMARTDGNIVIVDTDDFTSITIPIPEEIQNNMRDYRPDPYFTAVRWEDEQNILISYQYTGVDENDYNGEFRFNCRTRNVDIS